MTPLFDRRAKRDGMEQVISTMLVGICVGGLMSVAFIFDAETVHRVSRDFWMAVFG